MSGLTAMGGFVMFSGTSPDIKIWLSGLGVTLLAAAASAFNQVLERDRDALMKRTSTRPLPQNALTVFAALIIASVALSAGLAAMVYAGGIVCALLGGVTVLWYLMVYTPLKKYTPFALLAGAICGAIPPLTGWYSAGGEFFDYRIIIISGICYLWQIPHFWLIQNRYREDYLAAGFVVLHSRAEHPVGYYLCSIWIVALFTATMLLPAFGLISPHAGACIPLVFIPLALLSVFKNSIALNTGLTLFPLLLSLFLAI